MSDSAKVTENTAPSIQKCDTIHQSPTEGLDYAKPVTDSSDGGNGVGETEHEETRPTAEATIHTVPSRPKCFATTPTRNKNLGAIRAAIEGGTQVEAEVEVEQVKLLAQGGYNNVWLVSFTSRYEVSNAIMSPFEL